MEQEDDLRLFVACEAMRRTKAFKKFSEKIKLEFEEKRENLIEKLTGGFNEPEEIIKDLRRAIHNSLILKYQTTEEGSVILNNLITRVMGLGKIYENPRPAIINKRSSGYHLEMIGMNIYKCALLNAQERYFSKRPKTRKLKKVSAEEIDKMFQTFDLIESGIPVMEVTRKMFSEIGRSTPTYDENAKRLYEQTRRWHSMIKDLIGDY